MFVRTRFQYGSLRLRKRERSTDVWEFRYYETSPVGKRIRQSVILGDQALYRTEADARKATQALLMRLNDEAPRAEMEAPTFGALLDRYIEHELPERHSTQRSHLSNIRKHIRPRWSDQPINRMKPMAMEQWLRDLQEFGLRRAVARRLAERRQLEVQVPDQVGGIAMCLCGHALALTGRTWSGRNFGVGRVVPGACA